LGIQAARAFRDVQSEYAATAIPGIATQFVLFAPNVHLVVQEDRCAVNVRSASTRLNIVEAVGSLGLSDCSQRIVAGAVLPGMVCLPRTAVRIRIAVGLIVYRLLRWSAPCRPTEVVRSSQGIL